MCLNPVLNVYFLRAGTRKQHILLLFKSSANVDNRHLCLSFLVLTFILQLDVCTKHCIFKICLFVFCLL